MRTTAILLAAGSGSRLNKKIKKQFIRIGDKPILFYSLHKMEQCDYIDAVILVAHSEDLTFVAEGIVDRYHFNKISKIVPGGRERQDSVFAGLKAIDGEPDIVVIHDSARPFFSEALLKEGVELCQAHRAVIFAAPVTSTIKSVSGLKVTATLNRAELWEVQTPQIFSYSLILEAYEKAFQDGLKATDDAMMVEHFGQNVFVLPGDKTNFKITSPEDLEYANFILGDCKK